MTTNKKDSGEAGEGKAGRSDRLMMRSFSEQDAFSYGFYMRLRRAREDGTLAPGACLAAQVLFDVLLEGLDGRPEGILVAASHLVDRGDYMRRKGTLGPGAWLRASMARLPAIQSENRTRSRNAWIEVLHSEFEQCDDRARSLDVQDTADLVERELPTEAGFTKKALLNIASELAVRCGAFDYTDPTKARDSFRKYVPKDWSGA